MEIHYITKKTGEEKVYKYDTKEYSKKNRIINAEKINFKYKCECGGSYSITTKHNHYLTKKHKNYNQIVQDNIIDKFIEEDKN